MVSDQEMPYPHKELQTLILKTDWTNSKKGKSISITWLHERQTRESRACPTQAPTPSPEQQQREEGTF